MKKWLLGGVVVIVVLFLSGCYVVLGYSYVCDGYGGDVYYGCSIIVYDDGYYVFDYYVFGYYCFGYYGGYGYLGGVSVGVGVIWYGYLWDCYCYCDYDWYDYCGDDYCGYVWGGYGGVCDDYCIWSGSWLEMGYGSCLG